MQHATLLFSNYMDGVSSGHVQIIAHVLSVQIVGSTAMVRPAKIWDAYHLVYASKR